MKNASMVKMFIMRFLSLLQMKEFIREKIREELLMENRIKFDLHVPSDILAIKDVFRKNGYKLFIVGGAVRDFLLNKTSL